ncbi:putative tubby-like protein [Helianthus annuus]|nr:putative tubby-like protein [Helianthus annuus]
MTKVYPKVVIPTSVSSDQQRFSSETSTAGRNHDPVVLTVWKKSLLFSCDGFTVFDNNGNLVLSSPSAARASITDNWLVYDGETTVNHRFSVTKRMNLLNGKAIANVSTTGSPNNNNKKSVAYEIEGSYARRCCVVYDDKRRCVAEIKRKEAVGGVALGGDVFRLVVQPELGSTVAMALVVVLDQMFGGVSRRF